MISFTERGACGQQACCEEYLQMVFIYCCVLSNMLNPSPSGLIMHVRGEHNNPSASVNEYITVL